MNTKVVVLAVVGTLLLPVLPLVAGLIAGLGEWPKHALPKTATGPAAEKAPAERVAA